MTELSVRNQTLAFIGVFVSLIAYYAVTTPTPLTLQAAPLQAGDRCFRCQRAITDRSIAVEGVARAGEDVRKFKTVACMLKYLRESDDPLDILVTDFSSRRFTQARFATYVRTTIDKDTGQIDYAAFRVPADAQRFAANTGAALLDWNAVQAAERAHPLIQ
jgi:hypothetical protein